MKHIELISGDDLELRLARYLQQGRMPDAFLYIGDSGAQSWLTLDSSDAFPIAARLQDLLERSIPELIGLLPKSPDLVSLGVGSGEKERLLLEAMLQAGSPRYIAVDISASLVRTAVDTAASIPVDTTAIVAFAEDLPLIRRHWSTPVVLCLLGNNYSNFDPYALLALVREQLEPGDMLLFDCHLLPEQGEQAVEAVYGSRQNALFNMNPLVQRGMSPDDCEFHLEVITVDSPAGPVRRTHKWLQVTRDAAVTCGPVEVGLAAGSTIELGFTFKHTLPQVEVQLARQGFGMIKSFADPTGENILVLARPYA